MHFFSPANVMKLLEVVRGEKTAQGRAGHRDGSWPRRSRRPAVVSGVCDGFIGNRMIEQYSRQAGFLLDEGAHAAAGRQGDREVRLRDGPVPHGRPGRQRHRLVDPQAPLRRERPTCATRKTADQLCELGRFGQKTGAGWYDYKPGKRDAIPSQAGQRHDREAPQAELGITPRKICDEEIVAAPGLRAGQRRRAASSKRASRCARQRHRHGLPHRLRLPAPPRRPDALRRPGRPVQRGRRR